MENCPLEARSRPHPRLSPCKPSCSLSATWGRPPPKCPRPAQPGVLCPSWVQGSRGTPAPLTTLPRVAGGLAGGPIPSGPGAYRSPTPPHSLALAAALALATASWRSWQVQTRSPQLPGRPTPSRGLPRGGSRAAGHSMRSGPAPRPPRASPRAFGASRTRGDPVRKPDGRRGCAGRGSVARASPQGPASGRCRQPRLPVAQVVGCAGVSSLWPEAGWRWEEGGYC